MEKRSSYSILCIVFFLLMHKIHARDVQISGKEAGFDFRGEYNRALLHSIDCSTFAVVELNEQYAFKGGISLGNTGGSVDIKAFTQGRIGPLLNMPLYFSLAYLYNGLAAWETHSHTLLPLVSFNGKWAGISIGPGFQFTRFFGESSLFESLLSFAVYAHFINNEKLRMGIVFANFNDFYAGSMGAYSLGLRSFVRLNEQWAIINDIELLQSGSSALAANFYGIAYRGGVRYSW